MKTSNPHIITSVEKNYLDKWMRREGMNKIYKLRNVPEIILQNYKDHLIEFNKTFARPGTDAQRLREITEYIDFLLNIFPKYKKFLKMHNMKSYEIGLMLGYKRPKTWHDSYKRYTYMKFVVNLISLHKELLETI